MTSLPLFQLLLTTTASLSLLSAPSIANNDSAENSTVTYSTDYFANYQPVTVIDMLRNIPGGVTVIEGMSIGAQDRGFGSSGVQILINGKRMPGKANNMATQLGLIQASKVARIDLIRGTAEGLDIRNEGILINIVLKKENADSSSFMIDGGLLWDKGNKLTPEGLLSYSGKNNGFDYSLSINHSRWIRSHDVTETLVSSDDTPYEDRPSIQLKNMTTERLTGNLGYTFSSGSVLRMNMLYMDHRHYENHQEDQFSLSNSSRDFIRSEEMTLDFNSAKWEVGVDFETKLGALGTLKAIAIANRSNQDNYIEQDALLDGQRLNLFSSYGDGIEEEQIFRTSVSKKLSKKYTFDYGVEGAFNTLDYAQSFYGVLSDASIVNEDRYEIFSTLSMKVNSKLHIQAALNKEFSEISQESLDLTKQRSFNYWKPRFELRYDLGKKDQLRLVGERSVSQLNLRYFVASRNYTDDTIDFGNPNLQPEKTWHFSTAYEHRFKNDKGSIEAEVFYDKITDLVDKIQLAPTTSGVGNIGAGKRYGANIKANVRLGFFGLKNAIATINYNFINTDVVDPFLDIKRPLKNTSRHAISLDFRHDLPALKSAYGFNLHKLGNRHRSDIYLQEKSIMKSHMSLYGEYTLSKTMKLRLDIGHIFRDKKLYNKTYYTGHIANGNAARIDQQVNRANTDFSLNLKATF